MDNDYGYANARLRAMKSRLLGRSAYAELLNESTVEDVVAALDHTVYQPEVETALIKLSGWDCLAEGLRLHLSQTLAKITRFFGSNSKAPDEAARLWQILIGRWQVFNLKTILRGQANHVPAGEILNALVPVGDLAESDFSRLVQQTSVRGTVDLLSTWNHPLARPLIQAMPRYAENSDLAELELALDRAHYRAALKELDGMDDDNADLVRGILKTEIDATNVLTLVRLIVSGVSGARFQQRYGASAGSRGAAPEAVLIPGGGIATQRLMTYKEIPTLDQLVRDLAATEFGPALARAQARYEEKQLPTVFEDEIEAFIAARQYALFKHDPLSIGIAVAYLAAIVTEVRNLRIIGRGKTIGWKREEIEKELRLWPS